MAASCNRGCIERKPKARGHGPLLQGQAGYRRPKAPVR